MLLDVDRERVPITGVHLPSTGDYPHYKDYMEDRLRVREVYHHMPVLEGHQYAQQHHSSITAFDGGERVDELSSVGRFFFFYGFTISR